MDTLDRKEKKKVFEAMAKEWRFYQEFRATAPLKAEELTKVMKRKPPPRIIHTRWVIVAKGSGHKARLVVIGCQETKSAIRTDSPTGSLLRVYIVLSYASQRGWASLGLTPGPHTCRARASLGFFCLGYLRGGHLPVVCPSRS